MPNDFPAVTEVERFMYKNGDRFIIHIDDDYTTFEQARQIVKEFHAKMNLPDDVPVIIVNKNWTVAIASDDEPE